MYNAIKDGHNTYNKINSKYTDIDTIAVFRELLNLNLIERSGTLNLTTVAGATITPTKSQQTAVAADRYTLGEIKIAAIPAEYITTTDANAQTSEIISGKTAYVNGSKITGSLVIQKYYTGTSAPASSLGNNGDIYFQS